jgi:hypothetical protein
VAGEVKDPEGRSAASFLSGMFIVIVFYSRRT